MAAKRFAAEAEGGAQEGRDGVALEACEEAVHAAAFAQFRGEGGEGAEGGFRLAEELGVGVEARVEECVVDVLVVFFDQLRR